MAKKQTPTFSSWLQAGIIRVCRVHFYLLAVYAIYTIASDATHLITPKLTYQRWLAAGLLLSLVGLLWYAARAKSKPANYYRFLIYALLCADIAFAGIRRTYHCIELAAQPCSNGAYRHTIDGCIRARSSEVFCGFL